MKYQFLKWLVLCKDSKQGSFSFVWIQDHCAHKPRHEAHIDGRNTKTVSQWTDKVTQCTIHHQTNTFSIYWNVLNAYSALIYTSKPPFSPACLLLWNQSFPPDTDLQHPNSEQHYFVCVMFPNSFIVLGLSEHGSGWRE